MARQLALKLPQWGGRRRGAGRKPIHPVAGLIRPGVPHLRRADVKARNPVHVTMRLLRGVPSLRRSDVRRALETAFRAGGERFGLRLVHYCILGNHLHLLVEVENNDSLSRGMQGLAVRCAKGINRALRRSGKVFADRFHARSLETRRQVANALRYVLHNAQHHGETAGRDPYSSERWIWRAPGDTAPVRAPRTWLLRVGWRPGLERRARG